ncbi:MAG: hypothetical protein WA707_11710, partial [Pseudolabrys sp.]
NSGHRDTYSITSSARTSNGVATSIPIALAALRLMTSSYLVGNCTGRSAGFSSFQNAVDIVRRTSVQVDIISAIGREPAICWVLAKCVQVWQPVLCGK